MTRRVRPVSAEEVELFHATVSDAKPLVKKKRVAKAAAPVASLPLPSTSLPPARSARLPLPPVVRDAPPLDLRPAPGIDKRTHERFRKGEMAIDGTLDLHGMTQDAAHGALNRFIERAAGSGLRNLLVITGKGGPTGVGVLKAQVPRWLHEANLRPYLLAIHRARPNHGGDGALYVLLKRKR